MRRLILALACLAGPALAGTAPQTIHVVRHFDTPAGEKDPDLLPQGVARAEALGRWFRGKRLCAILVSDYKRTRQTAAPLAAGRSIAVQTYDPRDTPGVVARARASACPVLIVGHSNTVPDIVAQLGGTRPADLAHEDFGDIWTIEGGRTTHATIAPSSP
ncbi:histidine phosphatase family protein [Sphingomonas suaedae]|uniref:Histidine phosphatase family protein n=1 Tax=Sphingomonas suaedae TaxID=2599297 RepID=A0A518RBW0_9SPHN|nr:phosphoglycerate mutase family protein [Sphingomonas suaedae]QDX24904.1 histidine phosphatase family protein [Sphingomonas suaedae]